MSPPPNIIKLTNCRLLHRGHLLFQDLYLSPTTGLIVDAQAAFFSTHTQATEVRDLGGRIVSPGWIEVQVNGGWGFDFSVPGSQYEESLKMFCREVVRTGVTSFVPTLTSQKEGVYKETIPHLAQKQTRLASSGAESLGAHCEGPFISPLKNGIHNRSVLQTPSSFAALEACYGASNLAVDPSTGRAKIKYITLAPELDPSETVIQSLRARGIVVSAGHSTASLAQMRRAVELGASMVTHMYNAMNQPHHREAGIVGILGESERAGKDGVRKRPYFGIIADDIHVTPSMVRVAYGAHPEGCILVTDAMMLLGCEDGEYEWTNGERIVKKGALLTLKGTDKLAGSSATMGECVNNLINWADISVAEALKTVTSTPAKMLGIERQKGSLEVGADADLVVLSENVDRDGRITLGVDEVWKFGQLVAQNDGLREDPAETRARL